MRRRPSRIVDYNVHPSRFKSNLVNKRCCLLRIANITSRKIYTLWKRPGRIPAAHKYVAALFGKAIGNVAAKPARPPRYDSDLPGKLNPWFCDIHHVFLPEPHIHNQMPRPST
jgi:hypothetical protein